MPSPKFLLPPPTKGAELIAADTFHSCHPPKPSQSSPQMSQLIPNRHDQLNSMPFRLQLVPCCYATIILRTYNGRIRLWLNASNHFNSPQSPPINNKRPEIISNRLNPSYKCYNRPKNLSQRPKKNATYSQIVTLHLSSPPVISIHPLTPQNDLKLVANVPNSSKIVSICSICRQIVVTTCRTRRKRWLMTPPLVSRRTAMP